MSKSPSVLSVPELRAELHVFREHLRWFSRITGIPYRWLKVFVRGDPDAANPMPERVERIRNGLAVFRGVERAYPRFTARKKMARVVSPGQKG